MRMGLRVCAVALTLLLGTAGCTGPSGSDELPTPTPTVANASELTAQRKAAGLPDCPAGTAPAMAGVPSITLSCIDGSSTAPLNQVASGIVVLNLWAQWCKPCRKEAPYLAEVSNELAGQVTFVGIDQSDPMPDKAIAFAAEAGWTYAQFTDPDSMTTQPPLQTKGLPYTLVIGKDGQIVARHPGQLTSATQLRELIAKAQS